jgi:hypothetical protein
MGKEITDIRKMTLAISVIAWQYQIYRDVIFRPNMKANRHSRCNLMSKHFMEKAGRLFSVFVRKLFLAINVFDSVET